MIFKSIQLQLSKAVLLMAAVTTIVIAGCGGSSAPGGGNGGGNGGNVEGAGAYFADFTRSPGDTQAFLALESDGSGSFVYYDVTGNYAMAHLDGSWDFGQLFTWTGTAGGEDVTLTGTVTGNPPVFNGNISGPFNTSFTAQQIANSTLEILNGTWNTWSSHTDSVWVINNGSVTMDIVVSNGELTSTSHATGSINSAGYFDISGESVLNGHSVPFDHVKGMFLVGPQLTQCHIYFEDIGPMEQGTKEF